MVGSTPRFRQFLERYSPQRDRAAFEAAWGERKARTSASLHEYEPNYEGSGVVIGPPGGVNRARGIHTYAAKAGHHLPPQLLSSGRNVFEELGPWYTLLAFGADAAIGPIEEAARTARVPLKIVRDSYGGGREAYGARLMLVRPDQYVVWTGDGAPAEPRKIMERVAGRG